MTRLTLEERISKLEQLIKESEEMPVEKGPEDYLKTLQRMIFKNKKLNPKGISPEEGSFIKEEGGKFILVVNNKIGGWHYEIDFDEPQELGKGMLDEFKKMVGVFCKINKCLVDVYNPFDKREPRMEFILKRWPNMPAAKPEPKPKTPRRSTVYKRYRSNDDDGYDYSDPEYRDMVKSAEWAQSQRDMGNW